MKNEEGKSEYVHVVARTIEDALKYAKERNEGYEVTYANGEGVDVVESAN